ncbi:hypothetical protein [Labrys miyagiensis]|uniref:hypothetical protein n=1 Tax=Labrys miyagiensis TaxID=346912 RepID=UPI0024E1409E|nr:hypothetical protein [Labrys miyagiensis]
MYLQPAGTAGVDGQIIFATPYNNLIADIGNEITNSLPTNGSRGMSANLPMNSNKIILLADPTVPTDAATKNYVDANGSNFIGGTTTGTANAQILAAITPSSFTMAAGNRLVFTPGFTPTGATTLTVTAPAIGPVSILKYSPAGPVALSGGEMVTGQPVEVVSNGSNLILITNSERVGKPTSISANTTYTASDIGRFIELTGSTAFTTTLPAPPATGGEWTVYNASTVTQMLSIPSGTFSGPGGSGSTTLTVLPSEFLWMQGDGTNWVVAVRYFNSAGIWAPGTLYGMNLSFASVTTYGVAAGSTVNEDGSAGRNMTLGSAFTKSLSSWAVGTGNGSLDTGSIAASTWYHVHIIRKDADASIDVLLSLSATSPAMPGGYTARRRIGSILTNGSSQITKFFQLGDEFLWDVPPIDVNATNPGTSAITRTLSVPTGVIVQAKVVLAFFYGSTGSTMLIGSLDVTDPTMQAWNGSLTGYADIGVGYASTTAWALGAKFVKTNTSAQVRSKVVASSATTVVGVLTVGWLDTRGK